MHLTVLFGAAIAFGVTALTVQLLLRLSPRALLDVPNPRSSHSVPTLRSGGLGVICGVTAGGALIWHSASHGTAPVPLIVLAAITAVAAVSFVDDLRSLPSHWRLLVHVVAAIVVVRALPPNASITLPLAGTLHPGLAGAAVAVLWCVGLTNAYNFLDGIDGIAGAQGVAGGLTWCAIGFAIGDGFIAGSGAVIAAASAAFLHRNWYPARIFLGDAGSATLGMLFATLPLAAMQNAVTPGLLACAGLLAVWPFIFDAGFTLVRRTAKGANLFAAHREHLYQRLVIAGWTHPQVAALYGAVASLNGAAALVITAGTRTAAAFAWLSPVATALLLVVIVARAERVEVLPG